MVEPDLVKAIRQNPGAYYVNVANAEFPGALYEARLARRIAFAVNVLRIERIAIHTPADGRPRADVGHSFPEPWAALCSPGRFLSPVQLPCSLRPGTLVTQVIDT